MSRTVQLHGGPLDGKEIPLPPPPKPDSEPAPKHILVPHRGQMLAYERRYGFDDVFDFAEYLSREE